MAGQISGSSDFTESFAIHSALNAALKGRHFDKSPAVKKAAQKLCRDLESAHSIFGRQLNMLKLMEKGATVAELGRKLKTSRRTLFRYLNYLENAGIDITLEDGKYRVGKSVTRMLR